MKINLYLPAVLLVAAILLLPSVPANAAIVLPIAACILSRDGWLTLNQAARKLGVNPSTVWRWALHGVRGIQLKTFSVGAKRFTTEESLEKFIQATTAAAAGAPKPQDECTSKQRQRDIKRAESELAADGI